jgi:MFS family permease
MRAPRAVAGLPRPFWVLWAGTLINRLGTMVQPFLALYLTRVRHVSLAGTGAVLTVWAVGSLISQPTAGVLADRIGRRATLAGGTLTSGAAMIALAYVHALGAIVVIVFLLGLSIDAYRPASSAIVADIVAPEDRPRAFGLLFWAINLGFSVAVLAGGWLAAHSAVWLFWTDAVTSAIFGLLVWWAVPETRQGLGEQQTGGLRDVVRDRLMMAYAAVVVAYAIVYLQTLVGLPLAMKLSGRSPAQFGLVIALNGVLIVLLQPSISSRLARRDHSLVLAWGMSIVGVGFGLTALATSTLAYACTVAVWTLGEIIVSSVGATIVADLAPAHMRGRYNGVYGLAWGVAGLLAPTLSTRLLAINHWSLWVACVVLCGGASAAQLAIAPGVRERSHLAAAPARP